jgi:hypothetical protein
MHLAAVTAIQPVAEKSQFREIAGRRDAAQIETGCRRVGLDL